jgi:hypothetical protein
MLEGGMSINVEHQLFLIQSKQISDLLVVHWWMQGCSFCCLTLVEASSMLLEPLL